VSARQPSGNAASTRRRLVLKLPRDYRSQLVFRLKRARRRSFIFKAARIIAQKIPNDPTERGAACRDYGERISNAWKGNTEFGDVLHLAYEIGVTKPLRDYVASGKPVPQDIVLIKGRLVEQDMPSLVAELLVSPPQQQQQEHGRPRRVASKAPAPEQAEHNAAWWVAFMLKSWREQNRRERVPRVEKDKMIRAAIEEAAKAFRVPVDTIKESNLRSLLKSGRIAVP
jgi:hypothetical protein